MLIRSQSKILEKEPSQDWINFFLKVKTFFLLRAPLSAHLLLLPMSARDYDSSLELTVTIRFGIGVPKEKNFTCDC